MTDFITTVRNAGFNTKDSLKIYEYIKKDSQKIKDVYSLDINTSLTALSRLEKVAQKWFRGQEEMLCKFFVDAEAEVKSLIAEMAW